MAELPGKPFDVGELQPCAFCGQGMAHSGSVVFYELRLSQCVIDMRNVQRMHGLEMMMGGAVGVARALSPSNNVAQRLPAERRLVCQPCLMERPELAILLEEHHG